MLNVVTPWCCILLGFLVAFRKPGEALTWPLLFFLCTVSQLLKANNGLMFSFSPLFLWPALFMNAFVSRGAVFGWIWFATQFPDPRSPNRVWPWARWVLGLPLLIEGILIGVWFAAAAHDPKALSWLLKFVELPDWIEQTWTVVLVGIGFANLVFKLIRETNPSLRRRLKWVAFGLGAGVLPVYGVMTIASMLNKVLDDVPMPILLPCILSPFLIPVTLAYAVLVDRLFDVGVVLRQGLLASKTVAAVRLVLLVVVIYTAVGAIENSKLPAPTRLAELVACVIAVVVIRRGANRLRTWVDRHFFQETVSSEHLLVELSSEVRAIRDPEALLRMVTDRIANAMHVSRVAALMPGLGSFAPAYAFGGGSDSSALAFDDPAVAELRESRRPVRRSDDLLVPISAGTDLQGILSLGPKRSEEPYSGRDMALLESVASQTGLALENSRLTATVAEEAAQRERITNEIEIARTVQERLFPRCAPEVPGLELAGLCRPAQTVGGDYYDFFATPSGAIGLAIGDIAGKGIPAALLMASLQASLRGLTLAGISDLADLMEKLNILMYDFSPANRFATFFCCLYDPPTGCLRYSSAGHNPALLLRAATGEAVWLKTKGVALGLRRKSVYEQAEVVLEPGDCLLLYTDGVTEARNPNGDEFEDQRLLTAIRRLMGCPANGIVQGLLAGIDSFAAGADQHDDITVIAAVRL
jgi:sigma-B regulation protein RsbU (phosphoserine phosphatase)